MTMNYKELYEESEKERKSITRDYLDLTKKYNALLEKFNKKVFDNERNSKSSLDKAKESDKRKNV